MPSLCQKKMSYKDHPKIKIPICPYCKKESVLTDSIVIYGKSYGWIYLCKPCNAYVGCHRGGSGKQPLGRLANAELRAWKNKAHNSFDPIWKSGMMNRSRAYSWLADKMGLPKKKCHIGMFGIEQCQKVVRICQERRK